MSERESTVKVVTNEHSRDVLAKAKRIVVKVGTSTLTYDTGQIGRAHV